jgi:hypothetical protein
LCGVAVLAELVVHSYPYKADIHMTLLVRAAGAGSSELLRALSVQVRAVVCAGAGVELLF